MKKVYPLIYICCFLIYLSACKIDAAVFPEKPDVPTPTDTTKTPATNIDKALLTGWWKPVEVESKLYFGNDNFFYRETLTDGSGAVTGEPLAGFWKLNGQKIQYSATLNGAATLTLDVSKLTADSLVFKIGAVKHAFHKLDSAAITSPAVSTVIGDAPAGYSGDGGLAINASISGVTGLTMDEDDNLYFCDAGNNVIRKISAADGKITTIAGTGKITGAPFADNSPAISAELHQLQSLAFDSKGNLYVSEANVSAGTVNKITPDGKISRVVAGSGFLGTDIRDGGPAINGHLCEPTGLACDSAGNLYIADTQNYRIRKVSAATGIISTIAGNGEKSLDFEIPGENGPATATRVTVICLTVDANNNLYFAEVDHGRIRKVNLATGMIATVAGKRPPGPEGDGGNALDARVPYPWGICVNARGDVYFSDYFTNIRKIDKNTNIISRAAGNGFKGYIGDGPHATAYSFGFAYQMTTDKAGNIYVADGTRIRKIAVR